MKKKNLDPLEPSIRQICVVGTSGSGKSTMAENLSHRLHIPHMELDAVHWLPGWQERDHAETHRIVESFTSGESWVVDGNYGFLQDILLSRAQAVVWLDYSLGVILWRLWWRTLARYFSGKLLWGTNREALWKQFFHRDSIFLWALTTYKKRKRQYSRLQLEPEYSHLKVYQLRSPRQAKRWLAAIAGKEGQV